MGGAVMLRIAHAGKRWFDRMVLTGPMIDLPGRLTSFPARALLRTMRLAGLGGRYIRKRLTALEVPPNKKHLLPGRGHAHARDDRA